jgi:hypothetical protein
VPVAGLSSLKQDRHIMNVIEQVRAPERGFKRNPLPLQQGNCFVRSVTAVAIGQLRKVPPQSVAAWMWPSDRVTAEVLERAATTPAMSGVVGWAAELSRKYVADTLSIMGGASAAAQMLERALILTFNGTGTITVPGLVVDSSAASFVAEGDPIPVRQFTLTSATLSHDSIATIAVLSREMIESSNAEALIGDALMRAAGLALDAAIFDATAATTARPAGLRNGIATLTASSSTDLGEAFLADMVSLVGAVAAVGGSGPYVLVMSPARAAIVNVRFLFEAEQVIALGSTAVGNDIIAIAPQALAAAIGAPTIETSNASTLHMDTAPSPVGAASPHRSVFQTESIALKMTMPASWALRDSRGVAWLTPTWK